MILSEGKVKFYSPNINLKGPGKVEGVFYNREMVFNRDSTIFLLANMNVRNALDALAATGIRGIRIAKELGIGATINDYDVNAYRVILKNVKLNGIDAEVTNRDANAIMAERRFTYVDIDPFGSPVPFIDMALRSGRILGISATDTATLSGRNSRIERRYLAKIIRGSGNHEIGIRVLLGYIARMAARFDLGIQPIFSFWRKHAYRVYVRVVRGSMRIRESLSQVRITEYGGPLWTGDIHNFEFLKSAKIPEIPTKKEFLAYLEMWKNEKFFLYYEIPKICSSLKISQPPLSMIIDALHDAGFEAYRTHFSPQGIRSNASENELKRILKSMKK